MSRRANNNSWYVYIAKAKTGRYYTGITTNPNKRIIKHNSGKGSRFAIEQGPFELVYSSKAFPDKSEARKREIQIKCWSREKKLKLISGVWK
ncbi:MAG: GIY-YIG nuclease family protein [Candidatus Levybacteria bacterium]|nr:GIY-YIG nuclease family protein [Candidatus Levybacteria bacterium]